MDLRAGIDQLKVPASPTTPVLQVGMWGIWARLHVDVGRKEYSYI